MSTTSLRWQVYISFVAALLASTSLSDCTVSAFSTTGSSTTSTTSSSSSKMLKDANMKQTYDDLAKRALEAFRNHKGSGHNESLWIACVGGPGAGKTTTAAAVVERLCDMTNDDNCAVAVPMDGYHYTKADLGKRARPDDESRGMNRRGAPWTFDAQTLAVDLAEAKRSGKGSLAEYCREISDPIPDAISLDGQHKIIIVEGNYLLLGSLEAEVDGDGKSTRAGTNLHDVVIGQECGWDGDGTCKGLDCPTPIGDEIRRWKDVTSLFDESWFIAPPEGVGEQRRRLIERSLQTWTPEKTEAWGGGTAREAATRRADFNDVRNARLVDCCRQYADVQVESI